jgi:hypothetical protein
LYLPLPPGALGGVFAAGQRGLIIRLILGFITLMPARVLETPQPWLASGWVNPDCKGICLGTVWGNLFGINSKWEMWNGKIYGKRRFI